MTNKKPTAQSFQAWVLANGKSEKTAQNYASTVKGPLSQWAAEADLIAESLFDIEDHHSLVQVAKKIRSLDIFNDRNKKGKGMYSSALNWYCDYIEEWYQSDITADIEDIYQQPAVNKTVRESLVATRLGQGKFREGLISYWGQCAATGYKQHNMLIASHIKPWRASTNQERLDSFNGFLFIPNLDKAFDKNFISFKATGEILISTELEEPHRLGINASIKVALAEQHQGYLEYHRDILFKNQ